MPSRGALTLALTLLAVCAGTLSESAVPKESADVVPPTDRQVMVTYPPAPQALWVRVTRELEQTYGLRTLYSWTMASLGEQCVVFEVPRGRTVDSVLKRLTSDPRVGTAQPVQTFATQGGGAYNDPYAHLQHSAQALRLGQAHRWATGRGVRVAVVDTGVDLDHPDLRGRIVVAHNFVGRGKQGFTTDVHGTAVAGVLAAAANNEVGIVGVAPGAEVLALKACWQQPPGAREAVCNSYTLAQAVDFAILQEAKVLNFSLAGPPDPLLGRLIDAALARGIAVVAADGGDAARSFPARREGVIGISGSGSPKGAVRSAIPKPSALLAAPGVDILTTVPHASYDFFSGSSFAAAQVSGIAALLLEKNPRLTPAQLAVLIRKTARAVGEESQVDACAALANALGAGECE